MKWFQGFAPTPPQTLRRSSAAVATVCLGVMGVCSTAQAEDSTHTPLPDAHEAKKPSTANEAQPTQPRKNIIPRRIPAPDVAFRDVASGRAVTPDYGSHRYTMVFMIASWNPLSAEVTQVAAKAYPKFRARTLQVFAIGSHDTEDALREWVTTQNFRFPVGVASIPFIEKLGNPKLPAVWLINHRGDMIFYREKMTPVQVKKLVENLHTWTDF